MIEDMLKERKEGDKPRFFLHEEMKAWLADNINIATTVSSSGETYIRSIAYIDQPKYNRYQENILVPTRFEISSIASLDGITLGPVAHTYIDLQSYVKVIGVLTKRVEELEAARNADIDQLIANQQVMQNELCELKKQLDEKSLIS